MAQTKIILIFLTVFCFGLFVRSYNLLSVPPSLNWDEVSHAYNALTLLTSGKDQWGKTLPILTFKAYGDYPTPLNLYLTVTVFKLLGANDFSLRFVHALAGALAVITLALLAYSLTRNFKVLLITGAIATLNPWWLFASRAVFQSNIAILFVLVGLVTIWTRKTWLGMMFLSLSLLAYHNTRIFIPLSIWPLWFIKKINLKQAVLITILSLGILLSPNVHARSSWLGIINPGSVAKIEEQRRLTSIPEPLVRFIYNRPVYLVTTMVSNISDYFLPRFLFFQGGSQYQFSLQNWGVFYVSDLIPLYIGLGIVTLCAPWIGIILLFASLPAAITVDRFAVIRSSLMSPLWILCTACGLVWLAKKFGNVILVIWFLILSLSFIVYSSTYLTYYPVKYSSSWQYGYKLMVEEVAKVYSEYDQILITKRRGEPHEFFLWYLKWPLEKLLADQNFDHNFHDNWYWVDGFDKFRFVNDWEMPEAVSKLIPNGKNLIVTSYDHDVEASLVKQINFLDNTPVFYLRRL